MIDDPDKTDRLTAEIEASLPLEIRLSPNVKSTLAKQSPESTIPDRCMVIKIFYMGDEGGIVCGLDIGGPDTKTPFIVSITHLIFDRRCLYSAKSRPISGIASKNSSNRADAVTDARTIADSSYPKRLYCVRS